MRYDRLHSTRPLMYRFELAQCNSCMQWDKLTFFMSLETSGPACTRPVPGRRNTAQSEPGRRINCFRSASRSDEMNHFMNPDTFATKLGSIESIGSISLQNLSLPRGTCPYLGKGVNGPQKGHGSSHTSKRLDSRVAN
jgi:hypothetical protein